MFKKSQQSGRSMVEMLGVLAIIGVLSVAGIAGYSMAMRKITVNDIMSAATQCAIMARTDEVTTEKNCTAIGVESGAIPSGVTIKGVYDSTNDQVKVTVVAKDEEQCRSVAAGMGGTTNPCSVNYTTVITTDF